MFSRVLISWLYCTVSFNFASGSFTRRDYTKGDPVEITVTNMSPGGNPDTGRYHLYPISYFDETANFCYADKFSKDQDKFDNNKYQSESKVVKADSLFSDDIFHGPRTIYSNFQEEHDCKQNCWRDYQIVNASRINWLIENDYRLNFFIDDLPIGKEFYDYNSNRFYVSNNVPIGYSDVNHVLHIYNHWQFIIYYSNNGLNKYNIVKAVMQQRSARRVKEYEEQCQVYPPMSLRLKPNVCNKVIFTFEYAWQEISDEMVNHLEWNNRVDKYQHYLINPKFDNIQHGLYLLLILFVAVYSRNKFSMIANFASLGDSTKSKKYEAIPSNDNFLSEDSEIIAVSGSDISDDDDLLTNWYSLKNDVFRKPRFLIFFSNLIGFGVQFAAITFLVLLALIFNIISVITPNEVKHAFFVLAILTGGLQSFVSATIYKNFHPSYFLGNNQTRIIEHKSLIAANFVFTPLVFFLVNSVLNHAYKSAGSIKYLNGTIIFGLFVSKYLMFYVPLSFVGSLLGLKLSRNNYNNPTAKINMIEKKIPSNIPFLNKSLIASLIIGVFPFSVISNRLNYLWAAILFNNLYFGYWNYLISLILAAVISVLINNLMVFNCLNAGDWKWHWLSINSGLAVGLYSFICSFKLVEWHKFGDIQSIMIFVSENLLVSLLIGAGFAGLNFYNAWGLIRKLYN